MAEKIDRERRDILTVAGAAAIAATALPAVAAAAQGNTQPGADRDNGPLGGRLQGVQHFGVTVQNMDRAFEFYTEVLGGTEVMRDGDFQGEHIHNTLLTDQEMVTSERERQSAPMSSNTNKITEGKSNGWALIYCKGPEGEQLEFVQALDPVKRVFSHALEARRRLAGAG